MGKPDPSRIERIPRPPGYPVIGNVLDLDPEDPIASLVGLMKKHGPIIFLKFPKNNEVLVGSQELVHELCDQERFEKKVGGALEEVRTVGGDGKLISTRLNPMVLSDYVGLFTAHQHEQNWAVAHRILIPSFGPLSIRGMFDDMFDVATQLIMKVGSIDCT
jgi:cytochrome P450/NADPH-cytochrome P450 reductase